MSSLSIANLDAYRFSTERLATDAGLRTPPRLTYGLPIVLPEDTRVRSHRVVDFLGRQYIEWSPNFPTVSYNPGFRPHSDSAQWPTPPRDHTLRYVDGTLGRFDYARFPQMGEHDIWSAAMLAASVEDAAPAVELLPVYQTWSCEASMNHGQFSTAVLNEFRTRRALFEQRAAAAKQQLDTAPYSRIVQKLRTTKPRYPGTPTIEDLARCANFEDAVDHGMTFARVSLAFEAYATMGAEAATDAHASDTELASCPAAQKHHNRQGRWLHGLSQEIAAYLLRNQYPAYLVHPSALVEFVDGAEANWLGMNPRQVEWSADWMEFASRASVATRSLESASTMFAPPVEHAWLMENADPASYGWALPGEEVATRRTPQNAPMPDDLPGRRRPSAARTPDIPRAEPPPMAGPSRPAAAVPPPGYSTVPEGEDAALSDDEEGVQYTPPNNDVQAVGHTLITIDPSRADYIQPPDVQTLARRTSFQTKGLMRYVLMEVSIQGQTRLIARHVGTDHPMAKRGYPFEDRENRRAIVFPHPPHLNWPGVVDGERFGYPAPNVLYYRLADNSGRSRPDRPSAWMYPMEGSGVRRVHVREGTRPPRPDPEQLPSRPASQRNIFTMSPLDARASDYWSEQYVDPGEFAGPTLTGGGGDAEADEPLPRYPGNAESPADDHAMDTTEDFAGAAPAASASTTAPPVPSATPAPRSTTPTDPPPTSSSAAATSGSAPDVSRDKGKGRADAMDTAPDGGQDKRSAAVATSDPYIPRGRYSGEFVRRNGRAPREGSALAGYSPRGDAPALGSPLLPRTMVVRNLHRWANAADLEYAIRSLMDAVGERGLGLLRALSAGTGEPDRNGQRPTFDVYFTFDTVRDASLAIEYAGRPWVFPTTGRRTRNAPADSRFFAFDLALVGEEEVAVASLGEEVLRYPWFTLYPPFPSLPCAAIAAIGRQQRAARGDPTPGFVLINLDGPLHVVLVDLLGVGRQRTHGA
ncbi:hypothetical protein GGF50DRAFT_119550 [Schizophyllum commune]